MSFNPLNKTEPSKILPRTSKTYSRKIRNIFSTVFLNSTSLFLHFDLTDSTLNTTVVLIYWSVKVVVAVLSESECSHVTLTHMSAVHYRMLWWWRQSWFVVVTPCSQSTRGKHAHCVSRPLLWHATFTVCTRTNFSSSKFERVCAMLGSRAAARTEV